MSVPVLLNAFHTSGGGGVSYLRGILPHLAADTRLAWTLLAPRATLEALEIPANVQVWEAPEHGFATGHLWEQLVLPWQVRQRGLRAVWCNANFVPLLAPRPMPILHTTARAGQVAKGFAMRLYWWALGWLTTVSLLRAPEFFTIAEFVVDEYLPRWLRWRRKGRYAPPAVTVPVLGKVTAEPRLLLAVGDFYAQKDYATLLRAMAVLREQVPEVRLEIYGRPVDGAVVEDVECLLDELELREVVTVKGAVPHATLLKRMRAARAVVSTSVMETFNMPLVEALAVGTPVVCTEAPYTREVLGDAALVVARGGDTAAALAVGVFALLENDGLHEMFRVRGLERARVFDWQATAKVIADGVVAVVE